MFAADSSFAREQGGPLTRAFLDALPAEWTGSVIVDSSLVWLTPGILHGIHPVSNGGSNGQRAPARFIHEPFPGATTGVRAEANRNTGAVSRLCFLGLDCRYELAEGELGFASEEEASQFWLPQGGLEARDAELDRRLEAGQLALREVPHNTIVELPWGALMRPRKATSAGFQLFLRATANDARPPANGRRNASML